MKTSDARHDPIELDMPEGVAEAKQAVQVISAWVADGTLLVTLNGGAIGERIADWGRLLAQIGHHAARAAELNGHMAHHEALQAIRQGFDAALTSNQPTMSGGMKGRVSH